MRALAVSPDLLLLNEPTASLDPGATAGIEELILEAAASGTKVIMVTHDIGQARGLSQDLVFMARGQVMEQGAMEPCFAAPETVELRDFLAAKLVI